MLCGCCLKLIKYELALVGVQVLHSRQGYIEVKYDSKELHLNEVNAVLNENGMGIISTREQRIVEQIKHSVTELIHYSNNIDSIVRKSDYLVEKLHMSYQQLSKLFSKHESITLERYIILHKIERIKELIDQDEYTLSEIAYMMDYSSVQYLSNQFKKETGLTVSEYKKSNKLLKKGLDNIIRDEL